MFLTQQYVLMAKFVPQVQVLKLNKDVQMAIIALLKLQKIPNMISDVKLVSFAEQVQAKQLEPVTNVYQVISALQELGHMDMQMTLLITQRKRTMHRLDVLKQQVLMEMIQRVHY